MLSCKPLSVRGLYSLPGLSKLIENEGMKLTESTNRFVMCHVIGKIGITVGQKIAQKRKQ